MNTKSNLKSLRNPLLLVITAIIWGVSFVAQSEGGDAVGCFSFNCIRSIIGGVVLIPVIKLLESFNNANEVKSDEGDSARSVDVINNIDVINNVDDIKFKSNTVRKRNFDKTLVCGGVCCGIILALASNLQQVGIHLGTPAGKAGFLTTCYILIVPIMGFFVGKKCGLNIWIGVVIALAGLYMLCINGDMQIQSSDIIVLICSVVFSLHIMVIDHYSPLVNGVKMSCIQFLVCGIVSAVPMVIVEMKPFSNGFPSWIAQFDNFEAWIAILYAGVMSCGVAYTLQIVGQKGVNPTIASLILSMESVFAVVAGFIILGEALTKKEICGCVCMCIAIALAQIDFKAIKKK